MAVVRRTVGGKKSAGGGFDLGTVPPGFRNDKPLPVPPVQKADEEVVEEAEAPPAPADEEVVEEAPAPHQPKKPKKKKRS